MLAATPLRCSCSPPCQSPWTPLHPLYATPPHLHAITIAPVIHPLQVSRNTFALFLQPSLSEPLDTPPGARPESVGVGRWKQGMSFGEFANETFKAYYS